MKSEKLIISSLLLFLLFFNTELHSQTEPDGEDNVQSTDSTEYVMRKSPWGAVLRSALVPGLGQIYNESYWKAPIVWGTLYYLADIWIKNDDKYKKYQSLYLQSSGSNNEYKENRDFYRDQRDMFAIYIGLAYLLNLVDAYVDAQLFDFDVSENPYMNSYQLNVRIKL